MKITGTITKVLSQKSGTSKKGTPWASQQYVLEANDEEKSAFLIEVFGQKEIGDYALKEGDTVIATFTPKVQEFNGRCFAKNSVTDIERLQENID